MRPRMDFPLCAMLLLLASPAAAVVQVSNLAEPLDVLFTANGTNFALASSFTTDGSAYQLTSITVAVTTSSSGTSELRLRANNAGAPGALIESLGSQTLPSAGSTQLTFSSPGHPALSANTTYWVTLGETGSGDFNWDGTTSTAQSGAWTIGDQALFSSNGGATWADVSFGPPNESAKFAVDASVVVATQYSMVGKFARSNGSIIDIPLVVGGGGNCGLTTAMGAMVPGMTPVYQGVNSHAMTPDPVTTLPIPVKFANPHGCVSGMGKIAATNAGAGAAFQMPTNAFTRKLPGQVFGASIPNVNFLVQLGTSVAVSGPPAAIPMAFTTLGAATTDHPAGTMIVRVPNTPMGVPQNLAMFRSFHKSAWKTQTGRAGANFTWCFGNPNCTAVTQGGAGPYSNPAPVIVKYNAGPNRFGGTMGHLIGSGPNPSSLALQSPYFGVVFLKTPGGVRSQRTGRGYADRIVDKLIASMNWNNFKTMTVYQPGLGNQMLITMVTNPGSLSVNLQNVNYGFPLTTGTVIVRNTGRTGGSGPFMSPFGFPLVVTLTAKGKDSVTPMGARNISLVAGAVAAVPAPVWPGESLFETPSLVQIMMPEPTGEAQWLAGAIALLGIALWRSRAVRPNAGPRKFR